MTASTCASSSTMRSSTSRCLIAARISRITPRRSLSPPFMAAFMSEVICSFKDIAMTPNANGRHRSRNAGRMFRPNGGPEARPRSIQALALRHVARDAAQVTLDRSRALALALLGRLFVELALADFGEDAGLLAGALETAKSELERLVLADFDAWHRISGSMSPSGGGR